MTAYEGESIGGIPNYPNSLGVYRGFLGEEVPLGPSSGGTIPNFLVLVKPMKNQFIASEDLEIVLPPFFDTANGVYVTSSDVCTLVVKAPSGLYTPAPTASRDANTDHWVANIDVADYEQGQWLIKATSDAADTLPQYLVLTWGDYVDEIRQATFGKWKIESNQLKLYKDDGTTVLQAFDLKDSDGNPTMTRIFERDPA